MGRSRAPGFVECPSIDDIPFPRERTSEEHYNVDIEKAIAYEEYASGVIESSMAKCKELYEKLQDAMFTVGTYTLSYDRAIESADFSLKQIQKVQECMSEITDETENKIEIDSNIEKYIQDNADLKNVLQSKRDALENLYYTLNDLSARVININNQLDKLDIYEDYWW